MLSRPPAEGLNAGYVLVLYARYLADPMSVEPAWRGYFETHGPPGDGRAAGRTVAEMARVMVGAMALVHAYRSVGHLAADLDPLGGAPPGDPSLDPATHSLTPESMAGIPAAVLGVHVAGETLADVLPRLEATYSGTIAYEVEHIASHAERAWLRRTIESGAHRPPRSIEERSRLLSSLTEVEALERFLGRAYLDQRRYSIEGLDVLVPMLDEALAAAVRAGTRAMVLGMAHRGRLDILAHVFGVPYETILDEFEAGADVEHGRVPRGPTDDIKYHLGAEGTRLTAVGEIAITLLPNPSHLEAVDPVVVGHARAMQTDHRAPGGHDPRAALPIMLHGDAAFAAQGVVAETFNLARLEGYATGGTLHIIGNNQLGFTTDPDEGRSTRYASDLAKGFDVPIIHVNADDPEACLDAVRLAMGYRAEFAGDVVIDVVGYRRYGHNEGDEPSYTQPLMYERIRRQPAVRTRYLERLASEGAADPAESEQEARTALERLDEIRVSLREGKAHRWVEPREAATAPRAPEPVTALPLERLVALGDALRSVPDGFTVHPKLVKPFAVRGESLRGRAAIDWGHAEALALASLVTEGVPVRLTGQDTERGTFSQRHLALFDARTGDRHAPIEHVPDATGAFEVRNSPLSEYACLGFEYGYATAVPETLVIWEAQFGDFANAAEVIIDQFIVAGLAKWGQTSRLTLLLPHGFEGQGPEHSSARLERFLALCANGNLRVAAPSTAGQYFHLLRRQGLHALVRPLVVMTPKSLLRLPAATSRVADLARGRFRPVLGPEGVADRSRVRRLVLCSGKFHYDLARAAAAHPSPATAIARIELLYPFPTAQVRALVTRFPRLRQIVWAQEEPRNMGALKFVLPELAHLVPRGGALEAVARPERSSPAEGYGAAHLATQRRLVRDALRGGERWTIGAGAMVVPWRSP